MADGEKVRSCGIIMPIGETEEYRVGHWSEVFQILAEAVALSGFKARLVSEADEATVIHKTIVQNIYNDEIVICDVSSRNPNVMIELGLRLAFDKPVLIVKDEKTAYPFDTTSLEYISYPSDLRFSQILGFKERLQKKLDGTLKRVEQNEYTTFLCVQTRVLLLR